MPLQILKSVDIVYLYLFTVFDPIDVKVWLLKAFSAWEIQWVVAGNKHSFIHSFGSFFHKLGLCGVSNSCFNDFVKGSHKDDYTWGIDA